MGVESNEVCMGWNGFGMVPINDVVMSLLDCCYSVVRGCVVNDSDVYVK